MRQDGAWNSNLCVIIQVDLQLYITRNMATLLHLCTQNDSTPVKQVKAHCGCHVTQHLIYLQTQCHQRLYSYTADDLWYHLSSGPTLLSATQCKSSQWRAESGQWQNKCISCHTFWTMNTWMRQYFFTLKSYSCTLWLVAPSLWMKFPYFSEEW